MENTFKLIWPIRINPKVRARAANFALFMMIPLIGLLDAADDGKVRVTAFFLIPVMLITWRMGRRSGYVAAVGAFLILLAISFIDRPYWVNSSTLAIDIIGRFCAFFVIVAILSNLHRSYLRQWNSSIRDPLTNLHNRLGFYEIAGVQMEISRRNRQSFAVAFLDCDNFKGVNDMLGHRAGDHLLQSIARILNSSIRRCDVACRFGGDEFVIYIADVGAQDAELLMRKIHRDLDMYVRARKWPVTFSIGVSFFESAPETVEDMIHAADSLMYETKKSGKDGLRFMKWQPPSEARDVIASGALLGEQVEN